MLKAVITYTASADPDLQEYELRGSFEGTKYNSGTASVLGSHPSGVATPFATCDGLVASGSKLYYKVFVILTAKRNGVEDGERDASSGTR